MVNFTELFCCQGCLTSLRQFCSTGNKESSYQISALLIILIIPVNLDGLVYALSTWKYERERDGLSMHQWRNSLVLWANPLGALIRIKCLSHLFSVADRNNESLNIVFQRNPSPSWSKDILRLFILSLIRHQRITPDQTLKTSTEEDGQRLN